MTDEQFKELSGKLDAINKQTNAMINRLGFDTTPREFIPYYNPELVPTSTYPKVFNKYGEPMEFFFISDRSFAHAPQQGNSRYIIWDRYNFGNKTHFYKDEEIFRTVGKPERKFAILGESKAIIPHVYENVLKHKSYIEQNFDLLFTYDAQILETITNARFVPLAANVWYGINSEGVMFHAVRAGLSADGKSKENVIISPENYKRKTKNISITSSAKEMCPMHILRKKLAIKCKLESLADTFGTFDGGQYVSVEKYLEHYRYSIVVENDISPFFFTEKIMNCFAAQTIPIYLGATQIDEFFNPAGIIQITREDCNHIEDILKQCTAEEYERRLPAVLDNFNRVQWATKQTRFDDMYSMYIKI